ncbi:hypothetical protein ACFL1M_04805 [Patescibacteria group bacterium]
MAVTKDKKFMTQEKENVLLEWMAPSRPFKKRNKEFYSTVGVIVLLISIILLFAKEIMLILAILSLVFFSYVIATVPPQKIEYKITSRGLRFFGQLYYFEDLGRYWFEEKLGSTVLFVEVFQGVASKLMGVLPNDLKQESVKKELDKFLVNEKPDPTTMDRAAKWIQEKVPLESK